MAESKLADVARGDPTQAAAVTPPTVDLASLTEEDLLTESDRLEAELHQATFPLLRALIESGRGELISSGGGFSYKGRPGDNAEIFSVGNAAPDGAAYRVALSRSEYPDFYAIKDRLLLVGGLARAKESARLLARQQAIDPASHK